MSQALPTLAVLSYDVARSRQPISAARAAGWLGFIAVAIAGLYGPIIADGKWVQGYIVDPSNNYQNICKAVVPVVQAFLAGIAGVLLFFAQRDRRPHRAGWVFAFSLTVIAIGLLAGELNHNLRDAHEKSLVRWTYFSSSL